MLRPALLLRRLTALALRTLAFRATPASAADAPPIHWIQATAHVIPKATTNDGAGYFSIVAGKNGRLCIGTARHRASTFLVEFDPLPFHAGIIKTPDGVTTTQYVILGVCQAVDGQVYALALHPYTLLQIPPPTRK